MTQIHLLCLFIYSAVFTRVVYTEVVMALHQACTVRALSSIQTLPVFLLSVFCDVNCDNELG